MIVEIPDPPVILSVVLPILIGVFSFFVYLKIRQFSASNRENKVDSKRLEFYEITIKNMTKNHKIRKNDFGKTWMIIPLVGLLEPILNHQYRSFVGPFLLWSKRMVWFACFFQQNHQHTTFSLFVICAPYYDQV